jgi:cysteinyl-tRNA synthetase
MSKSLGNLITIRDALKKYSADAIRIFVLSSYYRSPLTYTEEAIEAAERGAERLRQAAGSDGKEKLGAKGINVEIFRQRFTEAMDDDFNTAQAIAALFDMAREINRTEEAGLDARQARETLRELGGVLGLSFKAPEEEPLDVEPLRQLVASVNEGIKKAKLEGVAAGGTADNADAIMEYLISVRKELRKARQFQLADEIRNKLGELGIALEDTAKGTVWKRKR